VLEDKRARILLDKAGEESFPYVGIIPSAGITEL